MQAYFNCGILMDLYITLTWSCLWPWMMVQLVLFFSICNPIKDYFFLFERILHFLAQAKPSLLCYFNTLRGLFSISLKEVVFIANFSKVKIDSFRKNFQFAFNLASSQPFIVHVLLYLNKVQ